MTEINESDYLNDESTEGQEELNQGTVETQAKTPETPDIELEKVEAKKQGHLSKEDYVKKYGSSEGYKDEKEFNNYGKAWSDVSDVIKGVQKQLSERDKQIDALVKYNEQVEARAIAIARQQLEAQLADARQLGDVKAVEQLTREKTKQEFHIAQKQQEDMEDMRLRVEQEFRERNKTWMGINLPMTRRAQVIDQEERDKAKQYNIPLTYQQLANLVEARMRTEYPDEMVSNNLGHQAPNISVRDSQVNSGQGDVSDKSFKSLTPEQLDIFNVTNASLKRMKRPQYTKQEYINKLRSRGEI